jgi:hypothetical protein
MPSCSISPVITASSGRPAGPYRAKAKGKVERPFRYIRQDFFLARSCRNLDDLNRQLGHWLGTHPVKLHRTDTWLDTIANLNGKTLHDPRRARAKRRPVTAVALVRAYKKETERQRLMVKKATLTQSRLTFIVNAVRRLLDD